MSGADAGDGRDLGRLEFEQLPPELRELLRPRVERLGYLGEFFRLAGHQAAALEGFVRFTESLKEALPPRLTEIIALSVSAVSGNDYERHQHERLALALGFGDRWVRAVLRLDPAGAAAGGLLSAEEAAVQALTLACVDRLGRQVDGEMAAVAAGVDGPTQVAVVLTIGRYLAHAVFVNAWSLLPPVPSPLSSGASEAVDGQ